MFTKQVFYRGKYSSLNVNYVKMKNYFKVKGVKNVLYTTDSRRTLLMSLLTLLLTNKQTKNIQQ